MTYNNSGWSGSVVSETCQYKDGCTDMEAENFEPDATDDDGSCIYDD